MYSHVTKTFTLFYPFQSGFEHLFLLAAQRVKKMLHDFICALWMHTSSTILHHLTDEETEKLRLACQIGIDILLRFLQKKLR